MQGGFHGRTYGAMALTTSKTIYRQGFAPLMPQVRQSCLMHLKPAQSGTVGNQNAVCCPAFPTVKFTQYLRVTSTVLMVISAGVHGAVPQLPALQGAALGARRQRLVQGGLRPDTCAALNVYMTR